METKIFDASDAKNSGWTGVLKDVAEKVMPDSVFFEGIIHPTAKEDSYNGLFLREKDIKKWETKISNTDLLYEHDKNKKVGKILGGRMDAEKKFRVLGYVDTSKIGGIVIAEKMRRGELNGLSIGKFALATQKENGEKIVEEHDIFEVSVVQDPDLEGAIVHYVQPHNKNQLEAMKKHQKQSSLVNEEIPASLETNKEPAKFIEPSKEMQNTNTNAPVITPSTENKAIDPLAKQLEDERIKRQELEKQLKELQEKQTPKATESSVMPPNVLSEKALELEKEQKAVEELNKLVSQPLSSDDWKNFVNNKLEKKKRKASEMTQNMIKSIEENYRLQGLTPDESAKMIINQMHTNPMSTIPVAKILSVSHAANLHSLSKKEEEFQRELQSRKVAEQRLAEMEKQLQEKDILLKRQQTVGGYYHNTPNQFKIETSTPSNLFTPSSTSSQPTSIEEKSVGGRLYLTTPGTTYKDQIKRPVSIRSPFNMDELSEFSRFQQSMQNPNGLIDMTSKKQK